MRGVQHTLLLSLFSGEGFGIRMDGRVSSQAGTQTEQARQVGGWMENLCFVFGGSGRWGAEGMLPVDVVLVDDVGSVDR